MKAQRYPSLGLLVLSSALVLLSGGNVVAMSSSNAPLTGCTEAALSDGDCDLDNNTEECGYDGGDCCECTCVDTPEYDCSVRSGFSCLDPSASCSDNDGGGDGDTAAPTEPPTEEPIAAPTEPPAEVPTVAPSTASSCVSSALSDGSCDAVNNNEECGYDGGDCCECTCISRMDVTCGENAGYDCVDPSASCEGVELVEAGTKTSISTSANGFDERAGAASGMSGCQADGCAPGLTRDGVTAADAESRWSCAAKLVPGGLPCAIDFVFEDPQDIVDVEVAFYKGDDRTRTVEATINGEVIGEFGSSPGSLFNALGIQGVGVATLTLKAVGLGANDWLSFTEVRFLVEA